MSAELEVVVVSPQRVLYRGKADQLIFPGEAGVFEVLPHHRKIVSRLLPGYMFIDGQGMRIKRGVVKAGLNKVTVIVEEP